MCKVLGCPCVITTVSTDAKAKIAKVNGADHVITYKEGKVLDEIKKITTNELCDVVFVDVGLNTHEDNMLRVSTAATAGTAVNNSNCAQYVYKA